MPIRVRLSIFDADPDAFPSFTLVGKPGKKIDFYLQQCQSTLCFSFLVCVKGVKIFGNLGSILKVSEKNIVKLYIWL
jgi:hypothetical protein